MPIKFTRHAKRRGKLYQISESQVSRILMDKVLQPGRQEIIQEMVSFPYPLKIIFTVKGDQLTGITTYPLKKGKR